MVQHRVPCFVIADGGHARFVFPAADNALHTREALDATHLHDLSRDLGTDKPGRSFESGSPQRHAIAPRHDPHDLEKDKFARFVAGKICSEAATGAFDTLILVAPSHVISTVRDALDATTTAKLVGTLAKDLTRVPDDELYPHVREWVRPTHRA